MLAIWTDTLDAVAVINIRHTNSSRMKATKKITAVFVLVRSGIRMSSPRS